MTYTFKQSVKESGVRKILYEDTFGEIARFYPEELVKGIIDAVCNCPDVEKAATFLTQLITSSKDEDVFCRTAEIVYKTIIEVKVSQDNTSS